MVDLDDVELNDGSEDPRIPPPPAAGGGAGLGWALASLLVIVVLTAGAL
jgi:hypothetical protein